MNIRPISKITVFLVTLLLYTQGDVQAEKLKICIDSNNWYPFTYTENGTAKGLHLDIVKKAMESLNHQAHFTPLPWVRCMMMVKQGIYDGLLSASYTEERSLHLEYPPNAEKEISDYRINQVDYVAFSSINYPEEFNGNLNSLRHGAVIAVFGYSIVSDLREKGLHVTAVNNNREGMIQMMKSSKNVFVTLRNTAESFLKHSPSASTLKIHKEPIESKSYFLVFNKFNSPFSFQQKLEVWNRIRSMRKNDI